ncbi:MAG TPA: hypothetical protein VJW17_04765 [Pyrinomonadaceae bacterium]|nr:hypothetical protein [Pyrinomonadaceae bacterium]
MGISRVLSLALFLFLGVSAVNAYTVVMRDGRRVEIPNEFTVTNSTLTYDAGDRIQVTIQLNTVDIAATERANAEAPGSFLLKANVPKAPIERAPQVRRDTAKRSITNADIEKYRRARIENEDQRKDLGLPSLEERQREVAAIDDRTAEQVRNMRAEEEAYWRSRADALRAEMEANAQQQSLRQSPQEIPWSYSLGGFWPFDSVGLGIARGRFNRFRQFQSSPFAGFLATPITPFPTFPFTGPRRVFGAPVRINPRPIHMRHR